MLRASPCHALLMSLLGTGGLIRVLLEADSGAADALLHDGGDQPAVVAIDGALRDPDVIGTEGAGLHVEESFPGVHVSVNHRAWSKLATLRTMPLLKSPRACEIAAARERSDANARIPR
ncbi:hypothetical protein SAMN05660916_02434 [Arthrobacter sp. 31Cvi3.1E]|nr:hypothetical protein SAMN05660916_02434 [Arthrobacter sp. 31Cvi3.1E]